MNHSVKLLLFLSLSAFSLFAQKIKLVAPQSGVSIKIITRPDPSIVDEPLFNYSINDWYISSITAGPQHRQSNTKQDTFFVGIDSGFFKIKKNENLVLTELEGYLYNIELVNPDWLKGNAKRISLQPLERKPSWKSGDPQIRVKNVSLSIPSKSFVQRYYESYKDYKTDLIDHVFTSPKSFEIDNSVFKKHANIELARCGFLDTLRTSGLNQSAVIDLSYDVRALTEYKFTDYCFIELKVLVKFPESFGLQQNKYYTVRSKIGYDFSPENYANNRDLIADAISRVSYLILKDETLTSYFHPVALQDKPVVSSYSIVNKLFVPNLEEASQAVITVLNDKGHGSGCFIGNQGYILTNYHVISGDSLRIKILFQNGIRKSAVLVKYNAQSDLALLKCDTIIEKTFQINKSNVALGSDVYAIGTPNDINLGQSLSKGIVSGRRTIEGRSLIQSDVSVNEGNSGGALVNKDGYLVGIVCSKLIGYGIEGLSFAIPATEIESILNIKLVQN